MRGRGVKGEVTWRRARVLVVVMEIGEAEEVERRWRKGCLIVVVARRLAFSLMVVEVLWVVFINMGAFSGHMFHYIRETLVQEQESARQ